MDKVNEILKERSAYGDFAENSKMVQRMKHHLREHPCYMSIGYHEIEAIEMILHKIGRIVGRDDDSALEDSVNDICGYAQLILTHGNISKD